jgi:hypothetical protein
MNTKEFKLRAYVYQEEGQEKLIVQVVRAAEDRARPELLMQFPGSVVAWVAKALTIVAEKYPTLVGPTPDLLVVDEIPAGGGPTAPVNLN